MSKKIRILFDANPLVKQKTGVGFYTEGIVKALAEIPGLELTGHYFLPRGAKPELPRAAGFRYTSNSWLAGQCIKALRKAGVRLPWELLSRSRADVLFFPDFTTWPSLFNTPKILTIHDLTYIDHPEYVRPRNLKYLQRYVARDARHAKLVLTVSEFSKTRIVKALGVPASKIIVEPIPPPKPLASKKHSDLPANFILFIGTIEPRKNIGSLIEAYEQLPEELRLKYALVLAGGQGWDSDTLMNRIKELQAKGLNIVTTGYTDDAKRAALYRQATVVVLPSFYEGFGMPILDAMSYGTPVAISDLAVFREIAGNDAAYFDPTSVVSIKKALVKILTDDRLRIRQIKNFPTILNKYSWDKVAVDIYQEVERLVG
jgi:glycosyltransferase involved in cell wall biosynthesis